ncbi:LLM class flavin-dependent oxidoreductase [bacterium]|nr:LLM class flavin-dependent oxidoreductase [bacterium]
MRILDEVKMLLLGTTITQTKLAKLLGERLNKDYKYSNFHSKLSKGSIKYSEMKLIADILGYEIKFVKKENK